MPCLVAAPAPCEPDDLRELLERVALKAREKRGEVRLAQLSDAEAEDAAATLDDLLERLDGLFD